MAGASLILCSQIENKIQFYCFQPVFGTRISTCSAPHSTMFAHFSHIKQEINTWGSLFPKPETDTILCIAQIRFVGAQLHAAQFVACASLRPQSSKKSIVLRPIRLVKVEGVGDFILMLLIKWLTRRLINFLWLGLQLGNRQQVCNAWQRKSWINSIAQQQHFVNIIKIPDVNMFMWCTARTYKMVWLLADKLISFHILNLVSVFK